MKNGAGDCDNNEPVGDNPFRPCAKCGGMPNEYGDDHCIQRLGNVMNACCGHGNRMGYIQFDSGHLIEGYFTVKDKTTQRRILMSHKGAGNDKGEEAARVLKYLWIERDENAKSMQQLTKSFFERQEALRIGVGCVNLSGCGLRISCRCTLVIHWLLWVER